jgi:hypothetical protein
VVRGHIHQAASVPIHDAEIPVANLNRATDNDIEHRLRVVGRFGYDLEDLGSRTLLLESLAQARPQV